jgi:predicted nucleic acid-binding protein
MRRYAVIDTNVLVSAMLKWTSVPGKILEFAFSGTIIPVLNNEIVAEYREVLMRDRFHLTKEIVGNIKHFPQDSFVVTPREMLDIILGDKG